MRFRFLTVVFEVLKFVFDISTVLYDVLRVVLRVLKVANSCGSVSNSCVRGFTCVSVEILIPSSLCLPHTSDNFVTTTLTTLKAP